MLSHQLHATTTRRRETTGTSSPHETGAQVMLIIIFFLSRWTLLLQFTLQSRRSEQSALPRTRWKKGGEELTAKTRSGITRAKGPSQQFGIRISCSLSRGRGSRKRDSRDPEEAARTGRWPRYQRAPLAAKDRHSSRDSRLCQTYNLIKDAGSRAELKYRKSRQARSWRAYGETNVASCVKSPIFARRARIKH